MTGGAFRRVGPEVAERFTRSISLSSSAVSQMSASQQLSVDGDDNGAERHKDPSDGGKREREAVVARRPFTSSASSLVGGFAHVGGHRRRSALTRSPTIATRLPREFPPKHVTE
jgi:hypothetical protein